MVVLEDVVEVVVFVVVVVVDVVVVVVSFAAIVSALLAAPNPRTTNFHYACFKGSKAKSICKR